MPVYFIPHGAGPCFFMDWNPPDTWRQMADFLKHLADTLPARPSAILLVSGHWLAPGFSLTGHARHCHPQGGEEHLIPLLVAAGAADTSPGRKVYTERVMETTLSAFRFG